MAEKTPPTSYEQGIGEDFVSVLDFAGRLAQAVEEGDWWYLQDKARQLAAAAERLRGRVWDDDERRLDIEDEKGRRPRPAAVLAVVRRAAQHYRVVRALYPDAVPTERVGTEPAGGSAGLARELAAYLDGVVRVRPLTAGDVADTAEHFARLYSEGRSQL